MPILRGILGVLAVLGLLSLLSTSRRRFPWRVVGWGLVLQAALAVVVFKTSTGRALFEGLADAARGFFGFAYVGAEFVFGPLGRPAAQSGVFYLAFQALPILIYFSAITAILYHLGVLQRVVYAFSRVLGRLLGVSGAESMAITGNILVGMTEAPLLVRPYIEKMTRSELMALMTGGFATLAGTVLGVYMGFVGERFALYLIAGSFMAAPAALLAAKVVVPETEEAETSSGFRLILERSHANTLDAMAAGVRDGLHLALNVAAMLIAFNAVIALLNWPLETWLGTSLQSLLGTLLSPFAWCLGVDAAEAHTVGTLLGTKIILNEWIAYQDLQRLIADGAIGEKAATLSTFALCGFANLGSIGVTLGGIGQLAPGRRADLARLAMRAMVAGALASCLTASVAGAFLQG